MSTRILGSAATVAARMIELIEQCALDGMMLIFPDYLQSMPIFAAEIMPRLQTAFPKRGPGWPEAGRPETGRVADAV